MDFNDNAILTLRKWRYDAAMGTATELQDTLVAIGAGRRGSRVAAFFDVDGAVTAGAIADAFELRRGGLGSLLPRKTPDTKATVATWRGKEPAEVEALAGKVFAKRLADDIYPEARDLIAAHRRRGHTVVLTSAATCQQLQPLADALGADHVVGREVEVLDGRVTGDLTGPESTAVAVERWAKANNIDLTASHAYGSADDALAVLSLVGKPHPTNPASSVTLAAEKQGWQVLRFDSRGRPAPATLLRSLAGYGTALPSLAGGVGIGLLNRDREQIAQFGVNTWVNRLFALTGVTLRVQGEEHLWSHRPAVFIYNHRNNFDPYVAIKLVQRDWGSVAKKEIAGPLSARCSGCCPTWRSSTAPTAPRRSRGWRRSPTSSAAASRSWWPRRARGPRPGELGQFKKGPFRMAMEAGVALVPIVIHNADRVAGREAGIIRSGTIDVTVLPPVDVSGWTDDDLDKQIEDVRTLFVDALADGPAPS